MEHLGDGERVHARRHMIAVIFEDAERQDHRSIFGDGRSDLVRQHHFVTQAPLLPLVSDSATRRHGFVGIVSGTARRRNVDMGEFAWLLSTL
jgi:hypothetical protein